MEVVASLSQGRTAAAQCGLFTYKSVPVIFDPPCSYTIQMTVCIDVIHCKNLIYLYIYTYIYIYKIKFNLTILDH